MSNRLSNLQNIWVFGSNHALALLIAMLAIDLALTLVHSWQELRGKLWRYFGFIDGVEIPDWFGIIVFFVGLTLGLWSVGILGIGGAVLWRMPGAPGFLGALIGCRVSDGIFSHIVPRLKRYQPNPGLSTVPLYFLEAFFLSWAFYPTLSNTAFYAFIGVGAGGVFFFAIIPFLIPSLGKFAPRLFKPQAKWLRGTPRPDYPSTTSAAANQP